MSGSVLVINADGPETRVALIESGIMTELYIERRRGRGIAGNVYKGKVVRVLPGMQAAFVDIGTEKAAYLYVSDVRGAPEDYKALFEDEDGKKGRQKQGRDRNRTRDDEEDDEEEGEREKAKAARGAPIQDLVKEGQEILLQISKEPIGTKGARATCYISLPGRHLVFMPTVEHVGISRRITSEKERKRLRGLVDEMRPPGSGFIVRTVAEGLPAEVLRDDMEFLIRLWNELLRRKDTRPAPTLMYADLDLTLRAVRDLFTENVEQLIIDSRPEFERVLKFVSAFMPQFKDRVKHYRDSEPIFDAYGIEEEIHRAADRRVDLPSGGSLVFDQAEALIAIDVNTGRAVGKKNLEETITKTNLEAVKEIVYQLKLRNLGGIIVIDFIDMDKESNRKKVSEALAEALKQDKAKTNVTRISEMGLVEMTRKRTRESLVRTLTEQCSHCEGRGFVRSRRTVAYDALRQVRRDADGINGDHITITVHPEVAQVLLEEEQDTIVQYEKKFFKKIVVKSNPKFHVERYEVSGKV
jgi:ribonuclease G